MKKFKKESGITLIALIITIIILVILAAVSVRAITNMKIVEYATNGSKNYVVAGKEENKILDDAAALIESTVEKLNEDHTKGVWFKYANSDKWVKLYNKNIASSYEEADSLALEVDQFFNRIKNELEAHAQDPTSLINNGYNIKFNKQADHAANVVLTTDDVIKIETNVCIESDGEEDLVIVVGEVISILEKNVENGNAIKIGYRPNEENGWIFTVLEGPEGTIYQNGADVNSYFIDGENVSNVLEDVYFPSYREFLESLGVDTLQALIDE